VTTTITKTVVPAEVGPLQLKTGFTFVGDVELDGDESLAIGQRVEVCDDAGRYFAAVVTDYENRVWRLQLTP
jgi:hypothetical protein